MSHLPTDPLASLLEFVRAAAHRGAAEALVGHRSQPAQSIAPLLDCGCAHPLLRSAPARAARRAGVVYRYAQALHWGRPRDRRGPASSSPRPCRSGPRRRLHLLAAARAHLGPGPAVGRRARSSPSAGPRPALARGQAITGAPSGVAVPGEGLGAEAAPAARRRASPREGGPAAGSETAYEPTACVVQTAQRARGGKEPRS
jgi:hypothetical protein